MIIKKKHYIMELTAELGIIIDIHLFQNTTPLKYL